MVSEILDLKIEIERLSAFLQDEVMKFPIFEATPFFGGWSVLSSNGSVGDGWYQGDKLLKDTFDNPLTPEMRRQLHRYFDSYVSPTEICYGYLQQLLCQIQDLGLAPRRARISRLRPNGATEWHSDSLESEYSVRLHVPIITNLKCYFQTRNGIEHFPADGTARIIFVNQEHRVVNLGDSDRYHLIMDITDVTGITKHHSIESFRQKMLLKPNLDV